MISKFLGLILRLAELAFAAIVAGLIGAYLHSVKGTDASDQARFIYTEVVAGLAILFALLWLLPFTHGYLHWPSDIIISILWWVAFGLLVDWIGDGCGYVFNWAGIRLKGDSCKKWKAAIAFSFLSALCWLVSALLGFYIMRRRTKPAAYVDGQHSGRRRWYHRSP